MALTATQAIELLISNSATYTTKESILSLVGQLSLDATSGNIHGSVTVLYSGSLPGGVSTNTIVERMLVNHDNIRVINTTEAAAFLNSPQFKSAVAGILGVDIDSLDTPGTSGNDFLYAAKDSPWGDTSKRFVDATTGEVRVIAPLADYSRTFAQTELPALLANTKITVIDGIDAADLKRIGGVEAVFKALVADSFAQVHFSALSASNTASYLSLTPDSMTVATSDKAKLKAFEELTDGLSVDQKAKYKAGVDALLNGGGSAALSGVAKGLNKLGLVGGVLGFLFAASSASAAEESGNHEQAKEIMKLWAIDAAGSEIGSIAGAAITGIAVAAAAVAGVTLAAPLAGALIFGGALAGGFFGGDGATQLYGLLSDRDDNGRRDIVDKLSNLLFGATSTITTPLPADLNGEKLTIDASLNQGEIIANAKTSVAWRYALRELNSFVISDISYDSQNIDGSLDLVDPQTGQGAMTDEYLADRAAMLMWKMRFDAKGVRDDNDVARTGPKPYNEDWDTNSVTGNWDYVDRSISVPGGAVLTLAIDGKGISLSDHQVVFGSNNADVIDGSGDTDRLYGGSGNDVIDGKAGEDYLEGNAGNDTLIGGEGNDTLLGGAGMDTYKFAGSWGSDIIKDSDGDGIIEVEGFGPLNGSGVEKLGDNFWRSADKKITFTLEPWTSGSQAGDLYINFTDGRSDRIVVKNWSEQRNLGLVLPGSVTAPPATVGFTGDFKKATDDEGAQYILGSDGNYVSAGDEAGASDIIFGTSAADSIKGLGGSDALLGYGGDDIIEGGDGVDVLMGGMGADTLIGGDGNDVIYGSSNGSVYRPISTDFELPASTRPEVFARGISWVYDATGRDADGILETYLSDTIVRDTQADDAGNFIDAGSGEDFVLAGTGDDVVYGGDDRDDISGMAGADILFGDGGNDRIYGDGPVDTILLDQTAAELHGNDLLFGGSGNDLLIGQGGDDELVGGADDDVLWGDDRNTDYTPLAINGNDYLDGGDGADLLIGGGKDDLLFGGDGNDKLWGDNGQTMDASASYYGHDYLDGGGGDDELMGGGNDDTLFGGTGNDSLWGDDSQSRTPLANHGSDYLDGGDGDDQLVGGGGDDILLGGSGDDLMLGDDEPAKLDESAHGNDYLDGGEGNDRLYGGGGNDILVGGLGQDEFYGGEGDDTFVFESGDSSIGASGFVDTIDDSDGKNTVLLQGANARSLAVRFADSGGLVLDASATDHIGVVGGVAASGNVYSLGDGSTFSYNQLVGRFAEGVSTASTAAGKLHALGGKTSDVVLATVANATLSGGQGDDTLRGSGGNNSYLYELGDGSDTVIDTSARTDANGVAVRNRIVFGAGIAAGDVQMSTANGNVVLQVGANAQDKIVLATLDVGADGVVVPIDDFAFSDGTVLTYTQLLGNAHTGGTGSDTISGTNANDTIAGNAGDDTLNGRAGNDVLLGGDGYDQLQGGAGHDELNGGRGGDTFVLDGAGAQDGDVLVFNSGDGSDRIMAGGSTGNTLHFGSGVLPANLQIIRLAGSTPADARLLLDYGVGDQIDIQAGAVAQISNLVFADGTTVSMQTLLSSVLPVGTAGGDVLNGSLGADTLNGGAGDDALFGQAGDDLLVGGAGQDVLVGGVGANVYVFAPGSGYDVIRPTEGETGTLRFEGLSLASLHASVQGNDLLIGTASGDRVRIEGYGNASNIATTWNIEVGPAGQPVALTLQDFVSGADPLPEASLAERKQQFLEEQFSQLRTWSQYYPDPPWSAGANGNSGKAIPNSVVREQQQIVGGAYYHDSYLALQSETTTSTVTQRTPVYSDDPAPSQPVNGHYLNLTSGPKGAPYYDVPAGAVPVYGPLPSGSSGGSNPQQWGQTGWFVPDTPSSSDPRRIVGWTTESYTQTFVRTEDEATQLVLQGTAAGDFVAPTGSNNGDAVLFRGAIETGDGNDAIYLSNDSLGPRAVHLGPTGDWGSVKPGTRFEPMNAAYQPRGLGAWIDAGAGDDTVYGSDANDVIIGGAGNDVLNGQAGADTYLISGAGQDVDRITDLATFDWGANFAGVLFQIYGGDLQNPNRDVVEFDASVSLQQLTYKWNEGSAGSAYKTLELFLDGRYFLAIDYAKQDAPTTREVSLPGIERFKFTTGEVLSLDQLLGAISLSSNHAPTVAVAINDQSATEGSAWSFTVNFDAFVDEDANDVLHFSARLANGDPLPSWLTFDAATRTFSGTPAVGDAGSLELQITAKDNAAMFVSQQFELAIAAGGREETVTGTAGDDQLVASDNATVLLGLGGNDILDGGAGNDTLIGGTGDDTYLVDNAGDIVTELASEGTDVVESSVTYTLPTNVENLILADTATDGTGNTLDNILVGNNAANTLTGGAGDDTLDGAGGDDTMLGGTGDDTYGVDNAGDVVTENAGEGTDTVRASVTYTLGANVENLTLTGRLAIDGTGNTLANVLTGNRGANTLDGGAGNDTYRLGRGDGSDTITENDATSGNTDVALFGTTIATDQLWFRQTGNNLEVSVIGISDKFTLNNWYLGSQYHVEQFKTSDGKVLADSQVQNLVQAMASFSPPAAGQTTLPANYQSSLNPVIAANWH